MSTLKVDTILKRTGTGTITLGQSGDTISVPTGASLSLQGGTNGQALTTNGSGTLSFATVGGENTPYFHVYKSGDQTISNASFTTVTFDTEQYDSGSAFASNTFTAPSTGHYFIYSQLVWNGSTNSNYSLNRLMKNGSPINWTAIFQTENSANFGGRVVHLSASDTVVVQCYQDSGGSLNLRGGSEDECQFGGYKLIT
tara:strand:+ start:541 stop:1134 length:594 start_codon:yes stop_codon:yes gene_type:complete